MCEQESEQLSKHIVDYAKKRAHRDYRRNHDERKVRRFFARRPNDLAQLGPRLAKILHDAIFFLNFSNHR
jgi:hypothetical protein